MISTITEHNYVNLDRSTLRGGPITVYGGSFSSLSYRAGDVVVYNNGLYLAISDAPVSITPVGNPNFVAYDLGVGDGIKIFTNLSLNLSPGNYELTLQGGGGSGGYVNNAFTVNGGGGGGGAGYINIFDIIVTNPITVMTSIGNGGTGGFNTQNDGLPTQVQYFNPQRPSYITSFTAQGGKQGSVVSGSSISGDGGAGGYGGGGGQVLLSTPNTNGVQFTKSHIPQVQVVTIQLQEGVPTPTLV